MWYCDAFRDCNFTIHINNYYYFKLDRHTEINGGNCPKSNSLSDMVNVSVVWHKWKFSWMWHVFVIRRFMMRAFCGMAWIDEVSRNVADLNAQNRWSAIDVNANGFIELPYCHKIWSNCCWFACDINNYWIINIIGITCSWQWWTII